MSARKKWKRRGDRLAMNDYEARSRVIEKKPPMAAISLGTGVDAPRGEKMETSREDEYQIVRLGCPTASCGGMLKLKCSLTPAA